MLNGVRLTGLGNKGGYFYKLYINLPSAAGVSQPEATYLLGTLGAFEITGMLNHVAAMKGMSMPSASDGVQLVYPMTDALANIAPASLDKLTISFIRVNGNKPAEKGTVIKVKEFRVEASDTPL